MLGIRDPLNAGRHRTRMQRLWMLVAAALLLPSSVVAGSAGVTTHAATVPASVTAPDISAGVGFSCARTPGGATACWGLNNLGELGRGQMSNMGSSDRPVLASGLASGVASVTAAGNHGCTLTTGGGVKCWGDNSTGAIGNGSSSANGVFAPSTPVGLSSGVAAVTGGTGGGCALTTAGGVKCWGNNQYAQTGTGYLPPNANALWKPTDTYLTSGVASIASGYYHNCAVLSSGSAQCWGRDDVGQVGNGNNSASYGSPQQVTGLTSGVAAISGGSDHTCALLSSGGVDCWGADGSGQLGDTKAANSFTPVGVVGVGGTGSLTGVTALTAGASHTCVLVPSTSVAGTNVVDCWGLNTSGQLGDGTTTNRSAPVPVTGLPGNVVEVSAGDAHTCARTSAGALYCWGNNANGQLGNNSTTSTSIPVAVTQFVFGSTGGEQTVTVPAGADRAYVVLVGGTATTVTSNCAGFGSPGSGGHGGLVAATIPAQAGATLYLEVGGNPTGCGSPGFNGGGAGTSNSMSGAGASDIRSCSRTATSGCGALGSTSDPRLVVAAGGGGGGSTAQSGGSLYGNGGTGGNAGAAGGSGTTMCSGSYCWNGGSGGAAGSTSAGGAGGPGGAGAGSVGQGGGSGAAGGGGASGGNAYRAGGGGGGGWYGGGAGGEGGWVSWGNGGGGGGGGSNYVTSQALASSTAIDATGQPVILITFGIE